MPHSHHERLGQSKALRVALLVNGLYLGVEVVGGIVFDSLALVADGAHMFSDVAALSIALGAQRLIDRPPSARHTYGFQRAEVLAAQANAILLVVAAIWIVVEAAGRISDPPEVSGAGLLSIATIGLLVNLGSAFALWRWRDASLNMRAAFVHLSLDAAGSVGAMAAGSAVFFFGMDRADAFVSIGIAILILWSAFHLMTETTHVLLEGAPRGIDTREVERAIAADHAVEEVHHLHVWNLASDTPALSAHVVVANEERLHEAQLHADRVKQMLRDRFGIEHATLELECHRCGPHTAVKI
jgi:cobalt-zinc-cadmium efflux system protein